MRNIMSSKARDKMSKKMRKKGKRHIPLVDLKEAQKDDEHVVE